ncbi:separase, partial [Tanacetum coccineum]
MQETSGTSPTVDELSVALKNHDLFIYLGHGSGQQYISEGEIKKLDGCAAAVLMGCSSGSLYLKGSYTPKGAP